MCGITKRYGCLNTLPDALCSDMVTVSNIKYFTASADSTEKSFRLCFLKRDVMVCPRIVLVLSNSGSMHGMCAATSASPVMFYFQRQPCYPKLFFVVSPHTHSAHFSAIMPDPPTSRVVKRLKQSPHQMEHSDLPLAISVSRSNWRWFSITALTSYNRWITVTLSVWQAIIRETI